MTAAQQPWVASGHLSWFQRSSELFCHHDLIGYILGMSADIRELLLWWSAPHTVDEAVEEFGRQFPEGLVREVAQTLQAQRCLVEPGLDERLQVDELVPVKAKWRVAYTDAAGQVTLVLGRTSSERPRLRPLDRFGSTVWGLLDGLRTVQQVAETAAATLGEPTAEVLARLRPLLASWTDPEAQVVKLSELPLSFYKGRLHALPPYLTSTMPFPAYDGGPLPPRADAPLVDLRDYHRRDIVDATLQFDEVETTLNHLFRLPHPALQGRTYPGQLGATLRARGLFGGPTDDGARPLTVVEIGGGTGSFARGFLEALAAEQPALFARVHYTIVELSPALAASQRRQLEQAGLSGRAEVVAGDAEALQLAPGSVDLLIANEMIGDLRSARVVLDELEAAEGEASPDGTTPAPAGVAPLRSAPEALETIRRHELPVQDAPPEFHLNLGAIRLVEQLAGVLRPGGCAVLTEFGEEYGYPRESEHLDHAEFSIHFGHLAHVARRLGLAPHFEFLMDFLEMDRTLQTLATTRPFMRCLQTLFAHHGRELPKLALTRDDLARYAGDALALERIEALHFDRIEDRVCGLVPHHFKILTCRRPD